MRVAVITQDWPGFVGGGVATLAAVLAQGLFEIGADAEVWTRGGGARAGRAAEAAIPVRAFPGRSWRRRGDAHWARGVRKAVERFRPDLLVVTTWDPMPGVLRAAPGVPIRCFAFGRDVTGSLAGSGREAARARVWQAGIEWLTLTQWMRGELRARGVTADRVRQVSPGVFRPARPCRSRPTVSRLLTVGRLVPRKGQDRVIEAMALLRERHPEVRYDIVGSGPDEERLRGLVAQLRLGDRVLFHGRRVGDELEARYEESDLFVMPARMEDGGDTEGYGLVYLEAGARGLAAIAGAAAGAREAVIHGLTGLLVETPESAEAVADALSAAIRDPGRTARWGEGGRRRFLEAGTPDAFATAVTA